jgi:DNA-binding LytR/AlgR family response regulator
MNFYTRKPVMKDKSPSIFRISLKELEKILPANKFIRINKNCILNIDCINEVRGDDVRISELNKSVSIGDKFKEKIMNFINKRTGK